MNELYPLVNEEFEIQSADGIFGHSMGGHGALTLAFKYPEKFCFCLPSLRSVHQLMPLG